jgi:rhodanese-related sulfurtransferase
MNPFSFIFFIILIFCCSITGQGQDTVKFISLRPDNFQLAYLKEERAILIDVREFFEFRKVRLKDAVNIPSSGNFEFAADTINKQCSLFIYCTSGFRSKKAARYFYDREFCKLYSLEGGIVAWKKEGMPVVRKKVQGIEHRTQGRKK